MDRIEEFICRRFPVDCDWTNGNCYFFALILKSVFSGRLVYDPIEQHFLLNADSGYYDWTGRRDYAEDRVCQFIDWEIYHRQNPSHWGRIVSDFAL